MVKPGFFESLGKVSWTTQSKKISFCLKNVCCRNIPDELNALFWLGESKGSEVGDVTLECELLTLQKQEDGITWTATLTPGIWSGCLDPDDLLVEFICDGSPEVPVSDPNDCFEVFTAGVDPDPVALDVTLQEIDCCCDPVDGPTCVHGGIGVWAGARVSPSTGCSNGTWDNENDGFMGLWIYDTDEYGDVCCSPDPCPDEPPCPSATPCGDLITATSMPADLEEFF
jgi:hypothetical protein